VIEQARLAVREPRPTAVTDAERAAQIVHDGADQPRTAEGTEVKRGVGRWITGQLDSRILALHVDADEGIMCLVAELLIGYGQVALDQTSLEDERLELALRREHLHVGQPSELAAEPGLRGRAAAQMVLDAA